MTDKQITDRRLDEAIDRAVRDMMNVEPRTDLRARVLAELNDPPTRISLWPRLAFAAAALVTVIVAMTVLFRPSRDVEVPQVARTEPTTTAPRESAPTPTRRPDETAPAVAPGPRHSAPGKERTTPLEDRPVRAASLDTLDATEAEPVAPVEQLSPIKAIGVAGLEPLGVNTREIVINPITMQEIDITPLTTQR